MCVWTSQWKVSFNLELTILAVNSENQVSSWYRKKWKTLENWTLLQHRAAPSYILLVYVMPYSHHFSLDSHICCNHVGAKEGHRDRVSCLETKSRRLEKKGTSAPKSSFDQWTLLNKPIWRAQCWALTSMGKGALGQTIVSTPFFSSSFNRWYEKITDGPKGLLSSLDRQSSTN